jgi:hypothetical protein
MKLAEKLRIKDNPKLIALQSAMLDEADETAVYIALEERWDRYIRFGLEGGSLLLDHGCGGYIPVDRLQGRDLEYVNKAVELKFLKKEYRHYGSMSSGRYTWVVSTTNVFVQAIAEIKMRLNAQ